MPLKPGKANIGPNIKELERPSAHAPSGRPYEQALAIALKTAGIPKRRADGGSVIDGGFSGALTGDTPGRADALPVTVPDGSHVIPADVVSAIGGGNSAAGLKHLGKMFPPPKVRAPKISIPKMAMPRPVHLLAPKIAMPKPKAAKLLGMPHADGGAAKGVKCALSDGEFVVHPSHVLRIGEGDAERGHRALDHWTVAKRRENIEHQKNLPGPVGSGL